SDRTTLRQQNIDLAQLRHDLFGFVLLLGHSNVLLRLNSLLQGGPLFRGQTRSIIKQRMWARPPVRPPKRFHRETVYSFSEVPSSITLLLRDYGVPHGTALQGGPCFV